MEQILPWRGRFLLNRQTGLEQIFFDLGSGRYDALHDSPQGTPGLYNRQKDHKERGEKYPHL